MFVVNDYAFAKISIRRTMHSSPVIRHFTPDKRVGDYDLDFPSLGPPPKKTAVLKPSLHPLSILLIVREDMTPKTTEDPVLSASMDSSAGSNSPSPNVQ